MINDFRGQYRWLSNYHLAPVMYEGVLYPSSEHAYQAAKSLDPEIRLQFTGTYFTCNEARKFGQTVPLRDGWDQMKYQVMQTILMDKFTRHADLKELLLATGQEHLEEGNNHGDRFFGTCPRLDSCGVGESPTGQNNLGKILMWIRAQLRTDPFYLGYLARTNQ